MVERNAVYTTDQALSAMGFGKFQGFVLAYAGLGWIAEAMEIMILSFIGPALKHQWSLSASEESLITTMVFVGMLVGAYTWGLVSDHFGRRMGLLSIAIVTSGAGFLSAFSPNYASLVALRCLVGFGLGGVPVYLSWFLEFVPPPKRGTWMVFLSTFWTLGTVLEASLAWIVMPRLNWRWLLALSSIPSFMALIFYVLTPESPRYLCTKGRTSDALKILEKVARLNRKSLPPGRLASHQCVQQDEEFGPSEETHFLCSSKQTLFFKKAFSSILVLLSPKLIRTTLSLWLLFFGNVFSYYGVILLTSELSSGQSKCGSISLHSKSSQDSSLYVDVFITSLAGAACHYLYCPSKFIDFNNFLCAALFMAFSFPISIFLIYSLNTDLFLLELPGLVLSAIIVDRIGRKLSMALMFILGCIFFIPLIFHQKEIATTILLFGIRMCVMGTITIANIYAPEIYPTTIRSTGYGSASAVGRIGGMICPLVAVGLVTSCHLTAAVLLFVAVLVLSLFSVLLLPLETKGRELKDTVAVPD